MCTEPPRFDIHEPDFAFTQTAEFKSGNVGGNAASRREKTVVEEAVKLAVEQESAKLVEFYKTTHHNLPTWLTGPEGINYAFNRPWGAHNFSGTEGGKALLVQRFLLHQAATEEKDPPNLTLALYTDTSRFARYLREYGGSTINLSLQIRGCIDTLKYLAATRFGTLEEKPRDLSGLESWSVSDVVLWATPLFDSTFVECLLKSRVCGADLLELMGEDINALKELFPSISTLSLRVFHRMLPQLRSAGTQKEASFHQLQRQLSFYRSLNAAIEAVADRIRGRSTISSKRTTARQLCSRRFGETKQVR